LPGGGALLALGCLPMMISRPEARWRYAAAGLRGTAVSRVPGGTRAGNHTQESFRAAFAQFSRIERL